MRLALLSALLLCVACSSGKSPAPGGRDASVPVDSGTGGEADAGEEPDAGSEGDGGTEDDGGAAGDAGSESDGGAAGDAGSESDGGAEGDGGSGSDGGTEGDAGSPVDGGTEPDAGPGCVPPAPVSATTLASALNTPRRLAVDANALYISETRSLNPTKTEGRLLRLPRTGGAPEVVAEGFRVPDALAVDATYVYVLDADGLWRVHKATNAKDELPIDTTTNSTTIGGTELLLATLQGREVVVVGTAHRRLVRLDRDKQNRQVLFDGSAGSQVRGARLLDADVWFLVAGGTEPGLYRVPLDGSTPAQRMDATVTAGTSLEVTPTHFLVTEGAGGQGQVKRLPRAGGPTEVLADGLQGPLFPVERDGTVYFKDASAGSSDFLRRVRDCGTRLSDPVGPVGTGPGALLLDGTTLLYTSQESGTGGAVGRVP